MQTPVDDGSKKKESSSALEENEKSKRDFANASNPESTRPDHTKEKATP
jgi:hypothetical protein